LDPSRENILALSHIYFPEHYGFIQQLDQREVFIKDGNFEDKVTQAVSFLEYLASQVPNRGQ